MCGPVRLSGGRTADEPLSDPGRLRVASMRLDEGKRVLVYNEHVTISDIPRDVFRYVVNGRSALGWVVDRYRCTVDGESGIADDPSGYAGPGYEFGLMLSVITVSVETMKIVDALLKLAFGPGPRRSRKVAVTSGRRSAAPEPIRDLSGPPDRTPG